MIKKSILTAMFLLLLISITNAQEATMTVDEMIVCTAIEDRQPTGTDTTFSSTVEKVYCFTKVNGSADETTITHVWYYENEEKARVELSVRAKTWRTWSSKTIWKTWVGKWRVDVESATGDVLMSKEFTIE